MDHLLSMDEADSQMTIFFFLYYVVFVCRSQRLNSYLVHYVGSREPFEAQPQREKRGAVSLVLNNTCGGNLVTKT